MRNPFTRNPMRYVQGLLLAGAALLLGCTAMYSLAHANGEQFELQLANMSDEKVHDIYIITEDPRLGELLGGMVDGLLLVKNLVEVEYHSLRITNLMCQNIFLSAVKDTHLLLRLKDRGVPYKTVNP